MPDVHAILSASSSARWIACPPSALLNAQEKEEPSHYAKEGTDAHTLCEYLVLKALGRPAVDPTPDLLYYSEEMQECAESYRDYVMEKYECAKRECKDPFITVEQRVDFSDWVPNGFGTSDAIIISDGVLTIIDYKHGLGVLVDSELNTQMMCYALGAYIAFGSLYEINQIQMCIFQPRRQSVSETTMFVDELEKWADTVLKPAADLASKGEGPFCAGPHCQFCRIKGKCVERANHYLQLLKHDFADPSTMTDEDISFVLKNSDGLVSWASDVKDFALSRALEGKHYDGFKVVEGRSIRKFTDESEVIKILTDEGFDPYEKKLKGITTMTSELGKKKFNDLLGLYITKPQGKPVLVESSDKRPEFHPTVSDFND